MSRKSITKPLTCEAMANLVTVLSRDSRTCAVVVTSGASWARVRPHETGAIVWIRTWVRVPMSPVPDPDRGRLSTDLGTMTAIGVG